MFAFSQRRGSLTAAGNQSFYQCVCENDNNSSSCRGWRLALASWRVISKLFAQDRDSAKNEFAYFCYFPLEQLALMKSHGENIQIVRQANEKNCQCRRISQLRTLYLVCWQHLFANKETFLMNLFLRKNSKDIWKNYFLFFRGRESSWGCQEIFELCSGNIWFVSVSIT